MNIDGEAQATDFAAFEAQVEAGTTPADGGDPEPSKDKGQGEAEGGDPADDTDKPNVEGDEGENSEGDNAEGDKPKHRNKVPAHRRIAELTATVREGERREQDLRRQVEELQAGKQPAPVADQEDADDGRPNPENYELGDMDPKYGEDLIEWLTDRKVAKALQAREAAEAEREAEAELGKMQDAFFERAEAVQERYPDFEEVVTQGAVNGDWPCSEIMALGIMASEVGPDVAHHLATNKAEAVRISNLHPLEQARELGRIEARYLQTGNQPSPKKSTTAPPPPVTQPRGAGGRFTVSADTEDFAAFEKLASGG